MFGEAKVRKVDATSATPNSFAKRERIDRVGCSLAGKAATTADMDPPGNKWIGGAGGVASLEKVSNGFFSHDAGEGLTDRFHKGKEPEKKEFTYKCEERNDRNLTLQVAKDFGDERGVGGRGRAITERENVFEADTRVVAVRDSEVEHRPRGLIESVEEAREFYSAAIKRCFDGGDVLQRGFNVWLEGLQKEAQATWG